MHKNFIKMLSCITCHVNNFTIKISDSSSDIIYRGVLICKKCSHLYPIIDGIPCFLPKAIWTDDIKIAVEDILKESLLEIGV